MTFLFEFALFFTKDIGKSQTSLQSTLVSSAATSESHLPSSDKSAASRPEWQHHNHILTSSTISTINALDLFDQFIWSHLHLNFIHIHHNKCLKSIWSRYHNHHNYIYNFIYLIKIPISSQHLAAWPHPPAATTRPGSTSFWSHWHSSRTFLTRKCKPWTSLSAKLTILSNKTWIWFANLQPQCIPGYKISNLDVRSFLGFCVCRDTASPLDKHMFDCNTRRSEGGWSVRDQMWESTWTFSTLRVGTRPTRKSASTETASAFPPPSHWDENEERNDLEIEWHLGTTPPAAPCQQQAAQRCRGGRSSCRTDRRCERSEAKCSCRPDFPSWFYVLTVLKDNKQVAVKICPPVKRWQSWEIGESCRLLWDTFKARISIKLGYR